MTNAHGVVTPMFPPEKVLKQVAAKLISNYKQSMVGCVEEIEAELEKVVEESLDVVEGYPPLKAEVDRLAREQIRKGKEATVDLLIKHVEAEKAFMNVKHPHFKKTLHEETEETTENQKEQPAIGKTVGREVGAAVGGAAGGAAGTSVGGPVGGVVGGGVGKVAGGAVGEAVGEKLSEGRRGADDYIEDQSPEVKKKGRWLNGKKSALNGLSKLSSKYQSTQSLFHIEPDTTYKQQGSLQEQPAKTKTRVPESKESKAISREPKIQSEVEMVKRMVGDYLDIVHIIMRDQAPKYIMFSLVQALQEYLEEDMADELLKQHPSMEEQEKLTQWEVTDQVSKLLKDKEAIRRAMEVVAGFSQT